MPSKTVAPRWSASIQIGNPISARIRAADTHIPLLLQESPRLTPQTIGRQTSKELRQQSTQRTPLRRIVLRAPFPLASGKCLFRPSCQRKSPPNPTSQPPAPPPSLYPF